MSHEQTPFDDSVLDKNDLDADMANWKPCILCGSKTSNVFHDDTACSQCIPVLCKAEMELEQEIKKARQTRQKALTAKKTKARKKYLDSLEYQVHRLSDIDHLPWFDLKSSKDLSSWVGVRMTRHGSVVAEYDADLETVTVLVFMRTKNNQNVPTGKCAKISRKGKVTSIAKAKKVAKDLDDLYWLKRTDALHPPSDAASLDVANEQLKADLAVLQKKYDHTLVVLNHLCRINSDALEKHEI